MFARGCAVRLEAGEAGLPPVPEQDLLVQLAQQRAGPQVGGVGPMHPALGPMQFSPGKGLYTKLFFLENLENL